MAERMDAGADGAAESDVRRRKMRWIAGAAGWIALGAIVLVVGYEGFLALDRAAMRAEMLAKAPADTARNASDGAVLVAWLIALVPTGIFLAAMWQVRRLFRLLASAPLFHPALPGLLRSLGGLAIAGTVAGFLARTLTVLALTLGNPPGQRQLTIGLGSDEITSLIVGLLFFAFALVMQEALRLEEDNRSIV